MEIYYRGAGCQADEGPRSPGDVRVFYGPCCKYALAPVGRYAKIWDVPVITPGGLTSRFRNSVDFVMLTRFIPPYGKVAEFLSSLLAKFRWWHLSLLFHDNLGPDAVKGYPMCYDLMEAVGNLISPRGKRTPKPAEDESAANGTRKHCVLHREIFNENYYDDYNFDVIMDEIRNASRGQWAMYRVGQSFSLLC